MTNVLDFYRAELEALTNIYARRFAPPESPLEREANEQQVQVWKRKMQYTREQMKAHPDYNPSTHLDFLLTGCFQDFPLSKPLPQQHDPLFTAYRVLMKVVLRKKQRAA